MTTLSPPIVTLTRDTTLHMAAKQRLNELDRGGIFRCEWNRVCFIHFQIEPSLLQKHVPFELDLFDDSAWISVVAFTMRGFRIRGSGGFGKALFAPVARHGLLNLRTYVRHSDEPGIFFLSEWIPNPLSVLLGPRLFGLPYRLGRLQYEHSREDGEIRGQVRSTHGSHRLVYEASLPNDTSFQDSQSGTLDEFLLERYTAYTRFKSKQRLFRIWHEPWLQTPIESRMLDDSLLKSAGDYMKHTRLVSGNYSPGVKVWIGRPHRVKT